MFYHMLSKDCAFAGTKMIADNQPNTEIATTALFVTSKQSSIFRLTYPESNIFPRYLHRHSFLFCLRAVFTFKIIIKSIPRPYHVKDVHVPDLLWYPQCAQWPPANVHVICLVS